MAMPIVIRKKKNFQSAIIITLALILVQSSTQVSINKIGQNLLKAKRETTENLTEDTEDYPIDSHSGALSAFGQLVSSDDDHIKYGSDSSFSSRAFKPIEDAAGKVKHQLKGAEVAAPLNEKDKDYYEESYVDEIDSKSSKSNGYGRDGGDAESGIESQYQFEELYGYTYDEALDNGDGDSDTIVMIDELD